MLVRFKQYDGGQVHSVYTQAMSVYEAVIHSLSMTLLMRPKP